MAWCFESCEAFVVTSRGEARPNMVLEALSHGCLSLSTDRPPLPQMLAGAALLLPGGRLGRSGATHKRAPIDLSFDARRLPSYGPRARRRVHMVGHGGAYGGRVIESG
jgi:hypothetical protein